MQHHTSVLSCLVDGPMRLLFLRSGGATADSRDAHSPHFLSLCGKVRMASELLNVNTRIRHFNVTMTPFSSTEKGGAKGQKLKKSGRKESSS